MPLFDALADPAVVARVDRLKMPSYTGFVQPRLDAVRNSDGTITDVNHGSVMATVKVRLDGGDQIVTSSITKEAALDLELAAGQTVTVVATAVGTFTTI